MESEDRDGMPQGDHRESSCSDDDQQKIVMGPVLDNSDGLSRARTDHRGSKDEIIEAERERLVSADEEAGIGAAGDLKDGQSTGAKDDDGNKEEEKEITTDNSNDDSHLLQDHGWAWFVCLGGFFSHFITGGFERSDGVMFLEFTDRFKQSAQLTAWPAAICSTSRLVMGPLSTAFCNRFSARTATMVGTFVFAAGVIASGFAPSVPVPIFSYGLVQDNLDHNTATLDGCNTFHGMGMIATVTQTIGKTDRIRRGTDAKPEEIVKRAKVDIQYYNRQACDGLLKLKFEHLENVFVEDWKALGIISSEPDGSDLKAWPLSFALDPSIWK
ncbi:monocarboxylate transporter 10-like [Littorina saxatilis]|uniref:monocarboxylate transporter 10-like n=1 Tax=Littorina saxatilis TaxID=31220 RepID=UPI0038B4A7E7